MKNKLVALLSLIFILFNSCSDAEDPIDFDKSNMLLGYSELITESFNELKIETELLTASVQNIGEQSLISDIESAQNQLNKALVAFQKCKPFDIGMIENGLYFTRIGQWPILNNEIEILIGENNTISTNLLGSLGANQKGLYAMEYLLFNNKKTNTQILNMFTTETDNDRRRTYLVEISKEINRLVDQMISVWEDSYKNIFLANTINGVSGSENRIYNESAAFIDEVLKFVRTPKDEFSNESILPNQENMIGWHSRNSIDLVKASFESLHQIFTNNENDGLLEHLDFVNAEWENDTKVSLVISDLYNEINLYLTSIVDLEAAINSSDPTLDELCEDIQELLVLYRADIASWLSLILLVSDTDGD